MKTSICCIVKNEQPYIYEWVDYHLNKVGIDHIYIYEDYGSDSHKALLESFGDKITINRLDDTHDVLHYLTARTQIEAYKKYLERTDDDWVLFIDIDEFLTFLPGYDLNRLLEEYKDKNGVWLCWMFYGANGHIKKPDCGVLEAYTKPTEQVIQIDTARWRIKSFVNVKLCRTLTTLHECENGEMTNGEHWSKYPCYQKAYIAHYFTKSWEEWLTRIFKRGNMHHNFRTLDTFFRANPDMQHLKEKLIYSVRYEHAVGSMWLSRDLKIISGGNEKKILAINQMLAKSK